MSWLEENDPFGIKAVEESLTHKWQTRRMIAAKTEIPYNRCGDILRYLVHERRATVNRTKKPHRYRRPLGIQ